MRAGSPSIRKSTRPDTKGRSPLISPPSRPCSTCHSGEFLLAIFHEIGFFDAPANRDYALAMLREREEQLDRMKQKRTGE